MSKSRDLEKIGITKDSLFSGKIVRKFSHRKSLAHTRKSSPEGEDRQEIFAPEVTGTHKEIFAWENVAPEIRE